MSNLRTLVGAIAAEPARRLGELSWLTEDEQQDLIRVGAGPRRDYPVERTIHELFEQAVLAEAIQRGVVLTSKIANPKTPAYPTTTIRLNRAEAGIPDEAQRFHPVAVHDGSVAEAIEEERGSL